MCTYKTSNEHAENKDYGKFLGILQMISTNRMFSIIHLEVYMYMNKSETHYRGKGYLYFASVK